MMRYILLILSVFFINGCMPAFDPDFKPYTVEFEKTESYSLDLSSIPKPDKMNPIFVDEDFNETSIDNAKYIVLTPKEYSKVGALVKLAKSYKEIAQEQEILINTNVDVINSLKEYVALEQSKAVSYRQLWIDSENAYRTERFEHKFDNVLNSIQKGAIFVIGAALIVIL